MLGITITLNTKVTATEIKLLIEECLNKIRLCLKYIINNLKKSDSWQIQLEIAIDFILSKRSDEGRVIHSKIDYTEFIIYDNADEVFSHFFPYIKFDWKHQQEVVILSLTVFIYFITNAIK